MKQYDYRDAICEDIRTYIEDNDIDVNEVDQDELYDDLFVADSVTGNASGSYTFNASEAEENICHNWDLLNEACEEYGSDNTASEILGHGAEWCDVIIRCHLLGECLDTVLNEMRN